MSTTATLLAITQAIRLGNLLLQEFQAGKLTEEELDLKWVQIRNRIADTEDEWLDMERADEHKK